MFPFRFQSLEKFSALTHHVSGSLDAFMRVIHDTEFPNSVEATQQLLDRQGVEYERLKVSGFALLYFNLRCKLIVCCKQRRKFWPRLGTVNSYSVIFALRTILAKSSPSETAMSVLRSGKFLIKTSTACRVCLFSYYYNSLQHKFVCRECLRS